MNKKATSRLHRRRDVLYTKGKASINKSTHVGQPVFSVLFALLSLAGDSPPASKRTKIPRKSKAVRCEAFLPEQKCSQTRKRPQRILCVFSRALTQYEGISARQNRVCPCQSTLSDHQRIFEENAAVLVLAAQSFCFSCDTPGVTLRSRRGCRFFILSA